MGFFDRSFEYGGTIENLDKTKGNYYGVYMFVLPKDFGKFEFKAHSTSGKWKGKNPDVSVEKLKEEWVDGAEILYIGKRERKTVYERVLEHKNFLSGEPISARGGRIIGQIPNYEKLEVWYLKCDNPTEMKEKLLQDFKKQYKKLPFANLKG